MRQKKKKSNLGNKLNVWRQSLKRSSHGKYAFFYSCFCFSEHARGRGGRMLQGKPIRFRKAMDIPSAVGSCQRYKCARYVNRAQSWPHSQGQEVWGVRGSEDLAVEFHVFIVFLTLRASISHRNKECLYNPFSHVSHSSFGLRMFSALAEMTVGGNIIPEPSDLTCI